MMIIHPANVGRGYHHNHNHHHHRRRRTFFASSTDHTRLLKEAEVHRLDSNSVTDLCRLSCQYVLVDYGMDKDTVQKVPQLHLARLWLDRRRHDDDDNDNIKIYGAKVVNRSLGKCQNVCGKLVDAALSDCSSSSSSSSLVVEGWATLHGLSDHVLKQQQPQQSHTTATTMLLYDVARNNIDSTTEHKEAWELACQEFIEQGHSDEANLYRDHGGILCRIEHNADTSDYADTCAGSMAVFRFSL
jgi:hypothetical protein